jgi:hypothetical protein
MSVRKWELYAEAHEKYRRDWPASKLSRDGWMEIDVCRTPWDLESLFTDELTNLVRNFFQCEFAVIFRSFLERDIDQVDESALWHRDNGPEAHLRIIAPLVETDGGTAVISLPDSEGLDYDPPTLNDRVPTFQEVGAKGRWEVVPEVGRAIIFQSTWVLHKAIPPRTKFRKAYQLGLVPWSEPWWVFEEKHGEALKDNVSAFPEYEKHEG